MGDEERLSKYERENLLIKLEKEFAFAGATIPSEVLVDGERIKLRAFVFGMSKKRGGLTPGDVREVERIAALLGKKRRELVARIAGKTPTRAEGREALTRAEAREHYDLAMGLGRAIDTLYAATLPRTSVADEAHRARLEEGRRWLNLVRKVYSQEEKRKRD